MSGELMAPQLAWFHYRQAARVNSIFQIVLSTLMIHMLQPRTFSLLSEIFEHIQPLLSTIKYSGLKWKTDKIMLLSPIWMDCCAYTFFTHTHTSVKNIRSKILQMLQPARFGVRLKHLPPPQRGSSDAKFSKCHGSKQIMRIYSCTQQITINCFVNLSIFKERPHTNTITDSAQWHISAFPSCFSATQTNYISSQSIYRSTFWPLANLWLAQVCTQINISM